MIPARPDPFDSTQERLCLWHRLFADASPELVDKFNEFHAANPALYDRIKSKAAEARNTGRNKYSMWVIINVLRWDQEIVCNGEDFKISNDFIALYARLLVWEDAGYDGFFSIKQIIGRPVSRTLDDGWNCEITRVATDGTKNACSFLYGRCCKAAFAIGYKRVLTYTLPEEGGASLRAAGYQLVGQCGGGTWNRENRPRVDMHPTQPKFRWEKAAC